MDQRVIRSLKAYQNSLSPQKAFQAINKKKSLPAKTLDLSQQKFIAIANYLAKGKIFKEQQKSAMVDYDDSFGELHYEIVTLAAPIPYIPPAWPPPPSTIAEDFISTNKIKARSFSYHIALLRSSSKWTKEQFAIKNCPTKRWSKPATEEMIF